MSVGSRWSVLVLAGGSSRRMGRDKVWIEIGGEPALARMCRRLRPREGTGGLWVSARAAQRLPPGCGPVVPDLPGVEGEGPLVGLAAGLAHLSDLARRAGPGTGGPPPSVAVVACDAVAADPRDLEAMVVAREALGSAAVVALDEGGRAQPLLAVYELGLAARACAELVASGERRARALLDALGYTPWPAARLHAPAATWPTNSPEAWRAVCAALEPVER